MRINRPMALDHLWDKRTALLTFAFVLVADLLVGYLYTRTSFWVVIGGTVAVAATIFLFSSPRALILTVFVAKPVIDMLWFASSDSAGVSLNAQSLLSVGILGAALLVLAIKRIELPRRLLIAMLIVVATNLWAVIATPGLGYAAQYLIRIVCGFPLVFVVPAIVQQLPAPRRLLQLFFVVMGFVCLTVLLQPLGLLSYTSFDAGRPRATGFYYHPWDVARYMVILVPLVLAVLDKPGRERSVRDLPYWLLLALGLVVTYFTFLKAAWLAVLFQVLLWFYLTGRKRTAFCVLAATVVLVAFPLRQGFTSVFYDLWKLSSAETRGQALSGRIFLWGEYWSGLRSAGIRDIVFGQGYRPAGWATTGAAVHDDYLRVLLMNGIVGLMAYLGLLMVVLRSLAKAVRRLAVRRGVEWRIGVAVQCLLAAYILMGITADPSSYPSLTLYLWLLVGLVIGYANLEPEQADP
jgi:O-antigen ligase